MNWKTPQVLGLVVFFVISSLGVYLYLFNPFGAGFGGAIPEVQVSCENATVKGLDWQGTHQKVGEPKCNADIEIVRNDLGIKVCEVREDVYMTNRLKCPGDLDITPQGTNLTIKATFYSINSSDVIGRDKIYVEN